MKKLTFNIKIWDLNVKFDSIYGRLFWSWKFLMNFDSNALFLDNLHVSAVGYGFSQRNIVCKLNLRVTAVKLFQTKSVEVINKYNCIKIWLTIPKSAHKPVVCSLNKSILNEKWHFGVLNVRNDIHNNCVTSLPTPKWQQKKKLLVAKSDKYGGML